MARHKHILSNPPVPSADDIFTDREAARDVLRGFFDELLARPFAPSRPLIQVFHGVGGAGKSALCKKAVDDYRADMSDQGGYPLAFAHVDLDNDRITPAYPVFDLFAGRLRPALKDAGCALPLFDLYCLAWHGSSLGDGRVSAEEVQDFLGTQQKAAEVAGSFWAPLTDFATSLKAVDLVRKAGIAFRAARQAKRYAQRFPGLELTELREADFKRHAAEVLAGDLLDFLTEQGERNGHPRAVCITLDGFERIQSAACAHDAQWALQELCSHLAMHDPQPRCGFALFGRNRLQWRELYDQRDDPPDDTWDALLEQHRVGGLGEDDARHFLNRAEAWYAARPADPHCAAILPIVRGARDAILDAAEESAGEHPARIFHLYSLDLALRQIGSHHCNFDAAKHLGRGHKDLQQRFLRYMDETLRSAMQALALALTFDEAVFRLLVEKHAIKGIPVQGFHDLVGPGNGHVLPTGMGYRFHGKMQEALLAHLHDQPSGSQKAATVIEILVDHYAGQLAEAVRHHDTEAMQEAFTRAADILLTHAESELLDVEVFWPEFSSLDDAVPQGVLARTRLSAWKRATTQQAERLEASGEYSVLPWIRIAHLTGETGDARAASALFEVLLPELQRVLGPDHPDTLTMRNNIATWTGKAGDVGTALSICESLLPDRLRVLGPDHLETLTTRSNIAAMTGEAGDVRKALVLYQTLLLDQQRLFGDDHPDLLKTRANIAAFTGISGDGRMALALFLALLPERLRLQGPDHPDTLTTRNNIARWTGEVGDVETALTLLKALLLDRQRVLGPDHPDTLRTQSNIAAFTGQIGNARKALALFKNLLPDQERMLGPDHPETLTTRNNIAAFTGHVGDVPMALVLFNTLLADRLRVQGSEHPDTLTTRANIAGWTGEAGDAGTALVLFQALLPDLLRVLGPDHPHTFAARNNIAALTNRMGDVVAALALFRALLPDQQRMLGPDHPYTRATAAWIADLQQRQHPDPQTAADPPGQTPSPARNAPCPCGSGKRFKHCHGRHG